MLYFIHVKSDPYFWARLKTPFPMAPTLRSTEAKSILWNWLRKLVVLSKEMLFIFLESPGLLQTLPLLWQSIPNVFHAELQKLYWLPEQTVFADCSTKPQSKMQKKRKKRKKHTSI